MSTISGREESSVLYHQRGLSRKAQDNLTIVLFLLPAFLFIFLFQIYPLSRSVYYSFFDWKGFGPPTDNVGWGNFVQLMGDKMFWSSVWHSVLIVILSLGIQLPVAMLLALLIERDLPGRTFFRSILFLPFVFSEVIIGLIWQTMFDPEPQYGLINAILQQLGLPIQKFLGDPGQALGCAFAALTWQYFGLHMLLYIAGLQNVPKELEEAARIDGATEIQTVWNITLPMIGNAIRTSVYLSMLGALQIFGVIWIMTRGGPIFASETMATYMYRSAFLKFSLGYGSAVAVVMLVISLIFSIVYQRLAGRHDYIGGI